METDQPAKWSSARTFITITCHPLDKKSPVSVNHDRPSKSNVGDIDYIISLEIFVMSQRSIVVPHISLISATL